MGSVSPISSQCPCAVLTLCGGERCTALMRFVRSRGCRQGCDGNEPHNPLSCQLTLRNLEQFALGNKVPHLVSTGKSISPPAKIINIAWLPSEDIFTARTINKTSRWPRIRRQSHGYLNSTMSWPTGNRAPSITPLHHASEAAFNRRPHQELSRQQ